jgi:hypothetical protein
MIVARPAAVKRKMLSPAQTGRVASAGSGGGNSTTPNCVPFPGGGMPAEKQCSD